MSDQDERETMVNGFHYSSESSSSSSNASNNQNLNELEQKPETIEPRATRQRSREASRILGTVKWFNAKSGYGFITRHDTGEDVFVHHTAITRMNPRHSIKSLGDGELVEFNIMATSVTAPGGNSVRGNPYVSYIPIRRNDSFAAGDPGIPIIPSSSRRYPRQMSNFGTSRIPRWNPPGFYRNYNY